MSDDAPKPQVNFSLKRDWCPWHLEPFRARWPEGFATAMVEMAKLVFADDRVVRMSDGHAERLDAVVAECSPLCCFLGPARLRQIYAAGRVQAPTPIKPPKGAPRRYDGP